MAGLPYNKSIVQQFQQPVGIQDYANVFEKSEVLLVEGFCGMDDRMSR